jgi:hypothetical protein
MKASPVKRAGKLFPAGAKESVENDLAFPADCVPTGIRVKLLSKCPSPIESFVAPNQFNKILIGTQSALDYQSQHVLS